MQRADKYLLLRNKHIKPFDLYALAPLVGILDIHLPIYIYMKCSNN
jgi:hypothetical protein